MHDQVHPLAGKVVRLSPKAQDPHRNEVVPDTEFRVEDWWDHLTGGSWSTADRNPAALKYAMRAGFAFLPWDDEVVYGKIGAFGHLVHVSELGDVIGEDDDWEARV